MQPKNTSYTITFNTKPELILDVDDLEGIIHQLDAISKGIGMDFDVIEVEEEESIMWDLRDSPLDKKEAMFLKNNIENNRPSKRA